MLALTVRANKRGEDLISARIITMPVGPLEANCYFVLNESTGEGFMVDPGGDAPEILDTVKSAGARVAAILVTHGHPDHLGATEEVARTSGARVYASSEVGRVLSAPDEFLLIPGMPPFKAADIDQILAGGETLNLGGIKVEVLPTPGHSPGSLTFRAAGGLFCGDLLFRGAIGRVDLPGGSLEQLAESVKMLMETCPPDTTVFTGHGAATTLGWEKKNNPFLRGIKW